MADDYQQVKQNFFSELKAASNNKKSSLSYIKNDLSQKPLVENGIVQVIVVGGTNYISSLVKVVNGKNQSLSIEKGKLPIFKTRKDFSLFLDKTLSKDAEALGINFAFPLLPTTGLLGALDGILIKVTKEHKFIGLIGKRVGEFAGKQYFKKYKNFIPVTVANDTVCLTLSDQGEADGGMVLGTGFNMSLKTSGKAKKTIINLEAGNFNGFEISDTLKKIDEISEKPGNMLFEKAVAGKYLVEDFNEQAKALGTNFALKTTEDLSHLAKTNHKAEGDLAQSVLKRSAFFIAGALAGVYEFRNRPTKLEFVTEGSLFWKGYKYQENVQKQLIGLGVPKNAIRFKYVEDSSLKGAVGLLIK